MKKAAKIGRPPKAPEDRYVTPGRQLGRIIDEDWIVLQQAASKAGMSFTQWALEILLRNAKRQLKK